MPAPYGRWTAAWTGLAALLADYDLRRGRLWPLVLAAAAPALARHTRRPS